MKFRILSVIILALSFGLSHPTANADDSYTFIIQKQEQKKNTRWSLADWLETRDRMRLMDLWLAIHSPTPYEFFIGGGYQFGDYTTGAHFKGFKFFLAAYATIFGLELQRESAPNPHWLGLFNFRFFGYHAQGTNMTFHVGLRAASDGSSTRNGLMGLSLSFYFARFFGVKGLWYNYFDSNLSTSGSIITGSRYEGGAFLDFSFLRVYGNYFSEPETTTTGGVASDTGRTGFEVGTAIFF